MDAAGPGPDVGSICWFRRDLRLDDNAALAAALETARSGKGRVLCVFVFDTDILDALPDRDDRRVAFLAESVAELDRSLRGCGGGLLVLHGSARAEIPKLARKVGAVAVHASGDHEAVGRSRDAAVGQELSEHGAGLHLHHDHTLFAPDRVLTGSGTPYRVFTPYFRAWSAALERDPEAALRPFGSRPLAGELEPVAEDAADADGLLRRIGFHRAPGEVPEGGSTRASARLEAFLGRLDRYALERDAPALDGTSRLSVDLRFGTISVRRLVREARSRPSDGAAKWIAELAWREFYQAILHHFPRSVEHAFQERMEGVVWDDPKTDSVANDRFEAWKQGRTGYPFVDAAMRELRATGWMHNRCRMVVASFLTKDLHIHWKRGERWFARWLLDIELASNVGGWQWAASTGADGQPWFRIFHPVEQSRRWDPDGSWIRRWCPELARTPTARIHAPWEAKGKAAFEPVGDWPRPIVDHAAERRETLERFGRLPGKG